MDLAAIEEHFKNEYPREGCGVLSVVKGKKVFFPCTNIAEDDEDFIIDSKEYIKLLRTTDIIGIVHSHPDRSPEPTESDTKYCNTLGIPYYIFSYPDMKLEVVQPEKNLTELYGREYEFGVLDCFEAMRDYLKSQNIAHGPSKTYMIGYNTNHNARQRTWVFRIPEKPLVEEKPPENGCSFQGRCSRILGDICKNEVPPWQITNNGNSIRCHIPLEELQKDQIN